MASTNKRKKPQKLSDFDSPKRDWGEMSPRREKLTVEDSYIYTQKRTLFSEKKPRGFQPLTWKLLVKKKGSPRKSSEREIRRMQNQKLTRTEKIWLNRTLKLKALIISDLKSIQHIYKHRALNKLLQLILKLQKHPYLYDQRDFYLQIETQYRSLNQSFGEKFSHYAR